VDNVVCVDTLERFRGDVIVLERLRRVLAPGGRLVVRVPTGRAVEGG
jgi:SAM-dependent methyltransferase